MVNINQGSGKYGVLVKYHGGGTTTFYFETKDLRNAAFKRIKGEVTRSDKVSKKDR